MKDLMLSIMTLHENPITSNTPYRILYGVFYYIALLQIEFHILNSHMYIY